jgi:Uma2 family endonuclease
MAEAAPQRMTIEEFLAWDDGTDRRYELVRGEAVAMVPPSVAHGTIVINIGSLLKGRLPPPCRVIAEAGIRLTDAQDTYYQADLAVTCSEIAGSRDIPEPRAVIEVLSPSTERHDGANKLPDLREIASVEEVLLVWSTRRRVEHWRRAGDTWIVRDSRGPAIELLGAALPFEAIYDQSGV